ncbi:MAG TPA: BadF/BadG/BcrA/BcrD ATPase family protein [Candidatus Dormibacteraeota bacterium]|nr:BadF/BadG/BcrA/BcrD ATPase family protein [Candidatus Dormibacteraeota bacterium]
MPYYLGIDGGGTKTTCAVGDESHVLATATTGPSNIVRVGESRARESLQKSVLQACAAAGITPAQVVHTCVGGSGAARPELAAAVRGFLAQVLPGPIDVVGDMEIALEAAFDTGPGVLVIAGTGSIAYGRSPQGVTARAGGWGFAIGDEGSAHWIGRETVAAILRASDMSSDAAENVLHGELAAAFCKTWQVASLTELARVANSIPPPDFAALFPIIAASRDVLGVQVLSSAGRELAQVASVVIQRLFTPDDLPPVPVAMTGGVFRYAALVREDFYNELRRLDPRAEINPQVIEPVEGALRRARRAAAGAVGAR